MSRVVSQQALRLVVVPNDPIHLYEQAGYEGLTDYFNPTRMFAEVTVLSPLEPRSRKAFGLTIQPATADQFRSRLKELSPHVVRAYAGDWPADLVCRHRLHGVPVIVSVHDMSRERMHPSLRYADLIVCTSSAVASRVRDTGVSAERIRILPNRVDTRTFRPVTKHARVDAIARRFPPGRYLLHVGRKVEEKNLDTVIRALALLPAEYRCVFVGLGDTAPFVALAREHGVSARCFWIDTINNSELPDWYSWCDCFCVPSRAEGFGTVFIEAAACGAAIVTSDLAPMNHYLTHGHSAHLVEQYTHPARLAEAVRLVCEDEAYRRRLHVGAVMAARPFEKAAIDAAEAAIYREALARPVRSSWRDLDLARWRVSGRWGTRVARLATRLRPAR